MYKSKNLQINKTLEQQVKDEIERKGIASIKALSPKEKSIDSILKIMKEGDAEFKSKIGREMTYAEIRDMYG